MKTRPVWARVITRGQRDGRKDSRSDRSDEANYRFSEFY